MWEYLVSTLKYLILKKLLKLSQNKFDLHLQLYIEIALRHHVYREIVTSESEPNRSTSSSSSSFLAGLAGAAGAGAELAGAWPVFCPSKVFTRLSNFNTVFLSSWTTRGKNNCSL